jgi:hypothetical protein
MKSIIFLLFICFIGTRCSAQNRISLSDAATVDLPLGMQKISEEDALSLAGKQFNNEPIIMRSIERRKMESIFRAKNVLVSLHYDNRSSTEGHLVQLKKGFDEWHYSDSTYSANLEKINGNDVLIINYIIGNVGNYRFFLYNTKYTKALTGVLEFNKTDKVDATTILNHILQTVALKD